MKTLGIVSTAVFCAIASLAVATAAPKSATVVPASEVAWSPLNPARGDKSPKAGALWGDRTVPGPAGFLVEFADGFESPPHIHNVTYRGVVISGFVHNDDPGAKAMWMPAGSFWTQPAGEEHITAGTKGKAVAYIEIEDGPYLVHPADEAFDNGERPVNVDPSNIVWLDAPNEAAASAGVQVAYLWGNPREGALSGSFVKLPAGFTGSLRPHDGTLRVVVVQGNPHTNAAPLAPGSYFGAMDSSTPQITAGTEEGCILYVRAEGTFDVVPTK